MLYFRINMRLYNNFFTTLRSYYIEAWGRGIPRIIKSVTEAGLNEPTFIGGTELVVNLNRNVKFEASTTDQSTDQTDQSTDQTDQSTDQTDQLTDQTINMDAFDEFSEDEKKIIRIISENSYISQKEISEKIGYSISSVKYHMKKFMDQNVIERTGTNRKGQWIISCVNHIFMLEFYVVNKLWLWYYLVA